MAISANDTIRIGIIGCGGIANGVMPGLRSIENVEMVAFCDIIEEKAQQAAKDYGTEDAKVYTDYKKLPRGQDHRRCSMCARPTVCTALSPLTLSRQGQACNARSRWQSTLRKQRRCLMRLSVPARSLHGYQNRYRPEMLYLKKGSGRRYIRDIYYSWRLSQSPPCGSYMGRLYQ